MKETENFHHPAGTPLEPTGEQTEWKTREHPSSQTTVLSPQTPSMMIERIDVDHTWVIPMKKHLLTEIEKRERYKWYQLEKPAQDRTR